MSIWISFLRQIKPPDVQEKYMIGEKERTEHGVTLVDAPLLLDEGFGLEEGSLTTFQATKTDLFIQNCNSATS
jgi:hypothetical protein